MTSDDLLSSDGTNIHFSSKSDLWATPQNLFDACDRIFGYLRQGPRP